MANRDTDDSAPATGSITEIAGTEVGPPQTIRRFRLTVTEGPAVGTTWESSADRCSIGSHASNDLVIDEPTVSRFHCEINVDRRGARIRDLGSLNHVIVDGLPIVEAYLRSGSIIRLGRTDLQFQLTTEQNRLQLSDRKQFGSLVGTSAAMRSVFALLERAAAADATVLLEGATGTGKEGAAAAIHEASARADKPFIIVDCSAIPENLLESELFGHERGTFTGATTRRVGAFEEADGGTVFLDEIGELPLDLQPKLLRVLETRQIRRIGSNTHQTVDVRVIAATNRDLRAEVNEGRFRPDVYYRLAVVKVQLAPLSSRPEDLPILVERILHSLKADEQTRRELMRPEFMASLQHAAWPGNVRELRNYLERCLVFREPLPLGEVTAPRPSARPPLSYDASLPYEEARKLAIEHFERGYIEELLQRNEGKVVQSARSAQMDRVYLYRLMRRHGIKSESR